MSIYILILLATHYIGDFICQTHWQSLNKSKSLNALSRHIASYTVVLSIGAMLIFDYKTAIIFSIVNGTLHFYTDFVTSRITSYLWAKQRVHDFFVVVGLDQLIHQVCLIVMLIYFV